MAMSDDAVEVIIAKRDGGELSDSQIDWVIDAYTRGDGRRRADVGAGDGDPAQRDGPPRDPRWTAAMIASGERMDFSALSRPTADKHSTGGVGDKITLPAGAAGRGLRRRRAAAVRARARPHRRHARQARVDPRLAGGAVATRR